MGFAQVISAIDWTLVTGHGETGLHLSAMNPLTNSPPVSSFGIASRGVRDALGLASITICFSLIGIGGLVRDIGYPMTAGALSTALMWAGPAQVLLFGSLAAGTALPLVAVAILFSSLRFFPMTISIMPLLNEQKRPVWQLLLAAHLISITNWVEGMRRLPDLPPAERYAYFIGFGTTVLLSGTLATAAGYYLMGALPPVLAAALLFTTPMFFTVNLTAAAKTALDALPILLSVCIIVMAPFTIGTDYDLMVAGLVGGTLAYFVERHMRARAP
jgi:predicted branched-subunit amino acid permease